LEKIIVYSDAFEYQIHDLIFILYNKEYFGFEDSAIKYGEKIYEFIFENIDKPITRNSQKKYHKFGKKYLKYTANKRTTWYIFFDQKDNKFLVKYILNNHSKDFPELM